MQCFVSVLRKKLERNGSTDGVEKGAQDIEDALQEDPAQAHALFQVLVAVEGQAVDHGHDSGQTQADEHEGSIGAPFWQAEVLEPRDHEAAQAQQRDLFLLVNGSDAFSGPALGSPFSHSLTMYR